MTKKQKPRVSSPNLGFSTEPYKFKGFGWRRYIYIYIYDVILLMVQKSGKLTSWYCKHPSIYDGFYTSKRVVGRGKSEPSTLWICDLILQITTVAGKLEMLDTQWLWRMVKVVKYSKVNILVLSSWFMENSAERILVCISFTRGLMCVSANSSWQIAGSRQPKGI